MIIKRTFFIKLLGHWQTASKNVLKRKVQIHGTVGEKLLYTHQLKISLKTCCEPENKYTQPLGLSGLHLVTVPFIVHISPVMHSWYYYSLPVMTYRMDECAAQIMVSLLRLTAELWICQRSGPIGFPGGRIIQPNVLSDGASTKIVGPEAPLQNNCLNFITILCEYISVSSELGRRF